MGPTDVDIIRVFTREAKRNVADVTIGEDKDLEIVLEAEAGGAVHSQAGAYSVGIVVKDIDDGSSFVVNPIGTNPAGKVSGHFRDIDWPAQDAKFVFTVDKAEVAKHTDHHCQVHAHVYFGFVDRDASLAVSPEFVVVPVP